MWNETDVLLDGNSFNFSSRSLSQQYEKHNTSMSLTYTLHIKIMHTRVPQYNVDHLRVSSWVLFVVYYRLFPIFLFFNRCDVSNETEVTALVEKVKNEVGFVSILVNNAGIMPCHRFFTYTPDEIRKLFAINVFAHIWVRIRVYAYSTHYAIHLLNICDFLAFC